MSKTEYAVVVTIPFDFLLNTLKVMSDDDTLFYEDFLANALADRWNLSDLDFKVVDDQDNHSYTFTPKTLHGEKGEPNDAEFIEAISQAFDAYRSAHGVALTSGVLSGYASTLNGLYGQGGQSFLAD